MMTRSEARRLDAWIEREDCDRQGDTAMMTPYRSNTTGLHTLPRWRVRDDYTDADGMVDVEAMMADMGDECYEDWIERDEDEDGDEE